ncbi:two-component sensor histidine kinase [Marmoricola endophyticus]|uniref:histidine kinase n=1 Tax=Marmoricola endophyticus TaxID=2040280 RepID=A0A917BUW7_9ACTN|nr:histidine kinase [Marmoricola endophyticus]GGF57631.1 two-component sensor histidine kinase [Marmoricola endophyticus]
MDRPDSGDYTPALGWWGHGWRLLVCLAISALALGQALRVERDRPWLLAVDLTLGAVAYALVLLRRRHPMPVAAVIIAIGAVSGLAAGPSVLATVSLATRRVLWQVLLAGGLSVVASMVFAEIVPQPDGAPPLVTFGLTVAITVALLAFGMYIGSRRELLWSLRERARAAEDRQELRVEAARSAERERIAREMHDVLAHRISMVSMHAGALAYRTDLPPDQVRETADLIQRTSHEALTDLRQVLGTLREGSTDGPDRPDRPQPRLADLPALVEEARVGGASIDVDVAVDGEELVPEAAGRTVYRIVQEGLTNARKHAPACRVSVRVEGRRGAGLEVWVRNGTALGVSRGPHVPGAGLGLVGLRERTALVGGTIEADVHEREHVLHGWLPWEG